MPMWKTGLRLLGALLVAAILGGLLAGVADMVAMDYIAGTALGPESEYSPVLWTVIGGVVVYAAQEVSA